MQSWEMGTKKLKTNITHNDEEDGDDGNGEDGDDDGNGDNDYIITHKGGSD